VDHLLPHFANLRLMIMTSVGTPNRMNRSNIGVLLAVRRGPCSQAAGILRRISAT
jgi:hypothetical protein